MGPCTHDKQTMAGYVIIICVTIIRLKPLAVAYVAILGLPIGYYVCWFEHCSQMQAYVQNYAVHAIHIITQ